MLLDGPVGVLEAKLWTPDGTPPRAAAVICHPHPEHGGTMETAVVNRVARGLLQAGVATLRFNFRGVGRSGGAYHGSFGAGGEEDDALAALDFVAERFPETELWVGGFSFGARTAAAAAQRDSRVERVILVALPLLLLDCRTVATLRTPGMLIQAGEDECGNLAELEERFSDLYPGLERREIPGTDHLFRRRTTELQELVRQTAVTWLEERE
jgi:hypothetical protein